MAITRLESVSDYGVNSGVIDDIGVFADLSPGQELGAGSYIIDDFSQASNEVLKFYASFSNVTSTNFKILLGDTAAGIGMALQIDMSSSNLFVRLVTATGIDQTEDTIVEQNDLIDRFIPANDVFYPVQVELQGGNLRVRINNIIALETGTFVASGTNFGFCNRAGSSNVTISDVYWYTNQIVYGNVNVNGVADSNGVVILYNQFTYEVIKKQRCTPNGLFWIFIDDDPLNFNKYFMYGFIEGEYGLQPRGVSNITL